MDVLSRLGVDPAALASLCARHHIRRLSAFGSVLRDDFGPESDVDLVAEFEPGAIIGLRFFDIRDELEHVLGRRVDLLSREYLRPAYSAEILSSSRDVYVAA